MKLKTILAASVALSLGTAFIPEVSAQTTITPRGERYIYNCGEKASLEITVRKNKELSKEGMCKVVVKKDGGKIIEEKQVDLSNGNPFKIEVGSEQPGFIFCTANEAVAGIGFDPAKIKQGYPEPQDFDQYWSGLLKRQAEIKDPVKCEPLPDTAGAPGYNYYKLTISTIDNGKTYGFLGVPKGKGPFSAYVQVIAAGSGYDGPDPKFIRPDTITLALNVHPFPPEDIKKSFNPKYHDIGVEDRDSYYFRNAILGTYTAVEWLTNRPDYNKKELVYLGSSQGGGFGIFLAGLQHKFTAVAVAVPALGNHGGSLNDNAAGWPMLVQNLAGNDNAKKEKILKASSYYDTANFAKRIKCPVLFSVGFIDYTCRPSSVYAAYNNVKSPKMILNQYKEGHAVSWEALNGLWQWTQNFLPEEHRFDLKYYNYYLQ